ncbi:MAG: PPC domain-containing protein [Myxococcales bacterium]|nr:PPC domain-containing protein [Myxococcales bacterium]
MKHVLILLVASLASSCLSTDNLEASGEKDAAKLGVASSLPSGQVKLLGSLDFGQISPLVKYSRGSKRFKAYKFYGNAGDVLQVAVTSPNGGDAMAWVLDNDFNVIGYSDDANGSLNAAISLTLPEHPSGTHYVVYRDYNYRARKFQVWLTGHEASVVACERDSDFEKLAGGCCGFDWTAIGAGQQEAYSEGLACDPAQVCSRQALHLIDDLALCNVDTGACELTAPADIACGGRSINPHACPEGYECQGDGLAYDAPGECVRQCGGESGSECPDGFACADNPNDDCTPFHDGAEDCPTMCEPDCSTLVCGEGEYCTGCWGHFACIPDGAAC